MSTPCKECPFRTTSLSGWLGAETREEGIRDYEGYIASDTPVKCHLHKNQNCQGLLHTYNNQAKLCVDKERKAEQMAMKGDTESHEFFRHHKKYLTIILLLLCLATKAQNRREVFDSITHSLVWDTLPKNDTIKGIVFVMGKNYPVPDFGYKITSYHSRGEMVRTRYVTIYYRRIKTERVTMFEPIDTYHMINTD
jgi:hypothetical protein